MIIAFEHVHLRVALSREKHYIRIIAYTAEDVNKNLWHNENIVIPMGEKGTIIFRQNACF